MFNTILFFERIEELANEGCEIIRVAVLNKNCAYALGEIVKNSPIPVVADIHFDYRLALIAMDNGINALRLNPGNIGKIEHTQKVVEILECINAKNTTSKNKKTQKTILEKISNKIGVSGSENINSYPKDFQWVCSNCGKIHNQWEANCEECGEIGRIYWHLYTDNSALVDESEY